MLGLLEELDGAEELDDELLGGAELDEDELVCGAELNDEEFAGGAGLDEEELTGGLLEEVPPPPELVGQPLELLELEDELLDEEDSAGGKLEEEPEELDDIALTPFSTGLAVRRPPPTQFPHNVCFGWRLTGRRTVRLVPRVGAYDKDGNWKDKFGGLGKGHGTFNLPHGIWVDDREGRERSIVCDRANNTLQYLTLDGKHIETLIGYGLPANVDTWTDLMVVPELVARVTILDSKNQVVARLDEDVARIRSDGKKEIRRTPAMWRDGRFVHPHDACFDQDGNIYVAEWVGTGRVSKLARLS